MFATHSYLPHLLELSTKLFFEDPNRGDVVVITVTKNIEVSAKAHVGEYAGSVSYLALGDIGVS